MHLRLNLNVYPGLSKSTACSLIPIFLIVETRTAYEKEHQTFRIPNLVLNMVSSCLMWYATFE